MKKNYLLGLGILISAGVFAQEGKINLPKKMETLATSVKEGKTNNEIAKAGGDIVWSSDFSDPTDWTIDNDGQTGAAFGWNIDATESSWYFNTKINTQGNFAELNNGVPQQSTQALDVVYNLTTANPIPITTNAMTMSFMQYGAMFNDAQEVYISVDGTNWVLVGDNSDIQPLSLNGGSAYANPTLKTINLVSYVPASSTQIWVRFSWTTGLPDLATNPNVWVTYGWMIDDVSIVETYEKDLALKSVVWGVDNGFEIMPYYRTPISQVTPIKVGGVIENAGYTDKSDVVFNAAITSASFAGTSAPTALDAYETDTLFTTADFTPASTVASYTFSGMSVSSASGDDVSTNNTAADASFQVTNFTYARDKGVQDGTRENGGNFFEACNQFDFFAADVVGGIDVFIDADSETDAVVYANFRDISTADFSILDQTPDYALKASDKNKFITLVFQEPYTVEANTSYLVCFGAAGAAVLGNSGFSQDQTSFFFDFSSSSTITNQNAFYTNNTPMVRVNTDPSLSVASISNDFITSASIYPNPSSTNSTVEFSLVNASEVSVEVVDLTGKVVKTINAGKLNAGTNQLDLNVANFEAGIYYVNILTNGTKVSQKFVKK